MNTVHWSAVNLRTLRAKRAARKEARAKHKRLYQESGKRGLAIAAARDGLQAALKGAKPDEIKTRCIEAVRQAAAIVDAKAPADAAGFKSWLLQISQSVAEAAKEGGFLGFGGTPVSDAEKATLAELSGALKVA